MTERHRLVGLALLVSLALVAWPPAALARDAGWSAGAPVASSGPNFVPRLAYDYDGFVHVVYFSGPSDDKWSIFYTNNRGGSFAAPRAISITTLPDTSQSDPDIAIGRDGRVHVAYQNQLLQGPTVWYVESPDLGTTWGTPLNLSQSPVRTRAFEPSLAVDANNGLHIVWIDSRFADVLQTTYVYRPAGGAFTAPRLIGSKNFQNSPDITTTGSGAGVVVHVVYAGRRSASTSTSEFDVFYVTGVGGSFGEPRNLSNDPLIWSLTPTITSDGGSNLFLAWDTRGDNHDIVLSRSNNGGASWTPPVNLTPRGSAALNPDLAFGQLGGVAQAHLTWRENNSALYLAYNPQSNSFGPIESASDGSVLETAIGASPTTNQVAVVYRLNSSRAFVGFKGASTFIGATLAFDDQNGFTRRSTLQVQLGEISGEPVQMRYALDREPLASDPWQPLQASFTVNVPPAARCERTLYLQLRNAAGRVSQTFSRSVVVDTGVQASIGLGGAPGAYGGDGTYTARGVAVAIDGSNECSALNYLYLGSPSPFLIDDNRFDSVLPLPGGNGEGPQVVSARVQDVLGNEVSLSNTIIVDRTPPELVTGTLRIAAPATGLASPRAELTLNDITARDNAYPGGFWRLLIANTTDPALPDDDSRLRWQAVAATQGVSATIVDNWNVLAGLTSNAADRSLAGKDIQVRVRLIDGAGNASATSIRATVRLAESYQVPATHLPTVIR
jgi:hypothetical protein